MRLLRERDECDKKSKRDSNKEGLEGGLKYIYNHLYILILTHIHTYIHTQAHLMSFPSLIHRSLRTRILTVKMKKTRTILMVKETTIASWVLLAVLPSFDGPAASLWIETKKTGGTWRGATVIISIVTSSIINSTTATVTTRKKTRKK